MIPIISPTGLHLSIADFVARAEQLLGSGEPIMAHDAARAGLDVDPSHVRLRQLQALSLARSGDVERANALLSGLAAEGHDDGETLGMLARTHKDMAQRSEGAARHEHLDCAWHFYHSGFIAARGRNDLAAATYLGINAAAISVLMGELQAARVTAREVRGICESSPGPSDHWREATLAEAALILGEIPAAQDHYRNAARLAGRRHADISSARRQAMLLASQLPGLGDAASMLPSHPVMVFSGHMIDAPGRQQPRFPAEMESAVSAALRARLAALAPIAVYASAACGADLLCLEAARELGIETHIVLPFPSEQFRQASIDFAGAEWPARFQSALDAAESVTITSDHRASGSTATYEYANLVLTGLGRLRASRLDAPLVALAAWDPQSVRTPGGTATMVDLWRARKLPVEEIDLAAMRGTPLNPPAPATIPLPAATGHAMRALLFADAVGYSKLQEDQVPIFIAEFLGAVAALNRRTSHRFEHVETAGDGLYCVFADVGDAARYAIELSDLVRGRDWVASGLPTGFSMRIALHCGPVHCATDPVTERPIYTGPHTSRAARIEPITPPGQVYASQAFAAVASANGVEGVDMRYVGSVALAKSHGNLALYHVLAKAGS